MGCLQFRKVKFAEELLEETENRLLFRQIPSSAIFEAFSLNSTQGRVSRKQLLKGLEAVCQDTTFFAEEDSTRKLFYEHFYNRNCDNELQVLNCMAILFGTDRKHRKSYLLFKNYDIDSSGAISYDELEKIISDIMEVSIDLTLETAKSLHTASVRELNDYHLQFSNEKKAAVKEYLTTLLFGEISHNSMLPMSDFILNMKHPILGSMLTARKFRQLCITYVKRIAK